MAEQWKPIKGFDGYAVSDQGRVLSKRFNRPLLLTRRKQDGYLVVTLRNDTKKKQVAVHRLVASAFIGPIPFGMTVNHISGDKNDNRSVSLEIVTLSENVRHSYRIGLHSSRRGTGVGAKLKPEEVVVIKARLSNGELVRKIAADYCVNEGTIGCIKSGKSWNTGGDLKEAANKKRYKMDDTKKLALLEMYRNGTTKRELASVFGISRAYVYKIISETAPIEFRPVPR